MKSLSYIPWLEFVMYFYIFTHSVLLYGGTDVQTSLRQIIQL